MHSNTIVSGGLNLPIIELGEAKTSECPLRMEVLRTELRRNKCDVSAVNYNWLPTGAEPWNAGGN